MGPVGLRNGVEFGDLERYQVEGREARVEEEVEDPAGKGHEDDNDEEEGAEDAAAYFAAAAPSFFLLLAESRRVDGFSWRRWTGYGLARVVWGPVTRRFLEHRFNRGLLGHLFLCS